MSDLTEFDDLQLKLSDSDRGEGATHAESTSSEARAFISKETEHFDREFARTRRLRQGGHRPRERV
jgi:hypothetical protein